MQDRGEADQTHGGARVEEGRARREIPQQAQPERGADPDEELLRSSGGRQAPGRGDLRDQQRAQGDDGGAAHPPEEEDLYTGHAFVVFECESNRNKCVDVFRRTRLEWLGNKLGYGDPPPKVLDCAVTAESAPSRQTSSGRTSRCPSGGRGRILLHLLRLRLHPRRRPRPPAVAQGEGAGGVRPRGRRRCSPAAASCPTRTPSSSSARTGRCCSRRSRRA